ncbi:MAG: hypothetical protein GQ549_00095 [Gammaproteobacteria bacterium]|nr:hypothetical protein [Gammaproteobacteria bacterium]
MQENIKKPVKYAVILIGIALILILANEAYQYLYYKLPPKLVSVSLRYTPEEPCRPDTPMHMTIVNDGYREIIKTSFVLSVKVDEQSNSIAQLLSSNYSTDRVVAAGETYEGCWAYPKLYNNKHAPENLLYEAKSQSIEFSD